MRRSRPKAFDHDRSIVQEASGACGDLGTFIPHVIGAMTVAPTLGHEDLGLERLEQDRHHAAERAQPTGIAREARQRDVDRGSFGVTDSEFTREAGAGEQRRRMLVQADGQDPGVGGEGRLHAAVVHGLPDRLPKPPLPVERWHLADCRVGLAVPPKLRGSTFEAVLHSNVPIVYGNPAATSQQAFERAHLPSAPGPRATGHLDAARIAATMDAAAVTTEGAANAFNLGFLAFEDHVIEIWVNERWLSHGAINVLAEVIASRAVLEERLRELEAKFKDVAEAYATLKDADKRAAYDQLGRHRPGEDFEPSSGWRQNFSEQSFGGDARFDETTYAARVSELFGTAHHVVHVRADDFEKSWPLLTWHRDGPISEASDIAVYHLARRASRQVGGCKARPVWPD